MGRRKEKTLLLPHPSIILASCNVPIRVEQFRVSSCLAQDCTVLKWWTQPVPPPMSRNTKTTKDSTSLRQSVPISRLLWPEIAFDITQTVKNNWMTLSFKFQWNKKVWLQASKLYNFTTQQTKSVKKLCKGYQQELWHNVHKFHFFKY